MRLSFAFVLIVSAVVSQLNAETVQFDRDVRPILSDKCFFCHGPDRNHREADLRLDLEDEARAVIVAGDPSASELISRITTKDPDELMPPADSHKKLSPAEIEILTRWVDQGAEWTQHWAFITPTRPVVPATDDDAVVNPIDAFVGRRLYQRGREFSPPADREKLIRRITFDLTGMPPTIAEIDAFLNDSSNDAYEKVVERLLDSPRYGQRMALAWLDAARYGDTSVYHADGPRDMWGWRDAIVDAYNHNLPFDEFSIYQLAGDLIPDGTIQQRLLAGFNRNNGTTDEGGAIAEEYRVEYAVDRVKTTSTVWLGLTMECAQCHDHKYDPISQEDYYRFYAFFNVSSDGGMQTRNGNAAPTLAIPDPEKEKQLPLAQQQLVDAESRLTEIVSSCDDELNAWLAKQQTEEAESTAPEGCLARIPLIEGTGDVVRGSINAESTHKIHGKVEWVRSRQDWGLRFDGSNYVDLGTLGDFERTDSFSYGGWIKPQKGGGQGALLARMDDAGAHRGYDLLAGDGPISVHIIHSWPGNAIKVTTKKKLKPDQWHHVLATYDGSSKADGIKIFVNGEVWDWNIEQNGLTETIKTDKSLLVGSRTPGARFKGVVDEVDIYDRKLEADEIQLLSKAEPIRALLAIDPESRSEEQNKSIRLYYLASENDEYKQLQQQTDALRKQIEDLKKPMTTVMVMGDMGKPRETFVLNRGAYDSPTETKVEAGTLPVLPPMAIDAPRSRLGLARWLFRDDHPLTARVTVNRYWQMLFGVGLVSTPEDLGAQGEFPSHPELLDWLAVDFRHSGWDIKRMLKQIVMSRTYRQSSRAPVDSYRSDPDNRLLGRGPRFRLQGEFIRDNALFVSGLLVDSFGGPGVKPYQPPGLWAEVGLGGNPKFVQDHGDKLYRRSLYTYWKRSAPPPAMQIFDAPTREKCIIRRARTNTPLQALVTLNDTQFVEASRHFAQRIVFEGGTSTDDRIDHAFRLATARRPEPSERDVLRRLLDESLEKYKNDSEAAKSLLAVGESPRDETLDVALHAAWTVVASAILNLDETLTRE